MPYQLLAEFITKSRNWSKAKRGRELFAYASNVMNEMFGADTGCFLYQKRYPYEDALKLYAPWGSLSEHEVRLNQFLVDTYRVADLGKFSRANQWLDAQTLSPHNRQLCESCRIEQIGLWPLHSQEVCVGAMVLGRSRKKEDDSEIVTICATQLSLVLELLFAWRVADEMSAFDYLTGLYNRRGIMEQWRRISTEAKVTGASVLFGIVDLDDFKEVNDRLGHLEGDRILRSFAETLKSMVREQDAVGRLGGDEFVLILSTDDEHLSAIRERIADSLEHGTHGVTTSFGFSVLGEDGDNWEECYAEADRRLYAHKQET